MEKTTGYRKVGGILRLRCPNCGKAKVFHQTKYPFNRPQMKDECEACGYRFDREPGFFSGAVWLSYGLAVVEGLVAFFLVKYLIFGISLTNLILVTIAVVMLLAMWNYRLARVIWLNVFPV
jgi:uncharacterized protein (DUF983 family)